MELLFSVGSFTELREEWASHPLRQSVDDSGLRGFFGEVFGKNADGGSAREEDGFRHVLENEFQLTVDELFELFPGSAAVALFNLSDLLLKEAERPDLLIMAEFSGDAERLEGLMQIQFERNAEAQKEVNPLVEHEWVTETFMGETLHFDETFDGENTYVEDGYALVDGVFVLGAPEERLRSAVESIKRAGLPPVADSPNYLRTREESGESDVGLFLNLVEVMPKLNEALMRRSGESGMGMFGVTSRTLDDALALESMQAAFLDLDLTDGGAMLHSGITYEGKEGLLSLLTYADGPLPRAAYVPQGVLSTSISNFDFAAMLANLEKLMTVGSPNLPALADIQMQNIRNQTGVDLRAAVLENFGDQFVSASVLDESDREAEVPYQPQQVFIFELVDAASFSQALESFKDLVPGLRAQIETRDFEGQTIHTFRAPGASGAPDDPSADFSYVVTRSHWILNTGPIGLLQEVLDRIEGGGEGFWQSPEAERMFEPVARPDPVTRSYVDLEQMVGPMFESIAQAMAVGGMGRMVDRDQMPKDFHFPYSIVSEMNEAPDGLFSRAALLRRPSAE
ncbi:MAG: hypothetical protein ACLFVC_01675 [Opitutales bacterium]